MISYKPLQHTLIDKGIKKMELVKMVGISSSTLSKLNNDEYVALEVIERICITLNCKIEQVIEIRKGPGELTPEPFTLESMTNSAYVANLSVPLL